MAKKILFVEDDLNLAFVVQDNLQTEGYEVLHCTDGQVAWEAFLGQNFDMCIFDIMLPVLDGFSLAQRVREENQQIPIIFLSAKSLKEDRIQALKLGADDYLTKPFSIEELLLKMKVFIRRSQANKVEVVEKQYFIGNYEFDFHKNSVQHAQNIYALTLREAELLQLFYENLNKILKREDILMRIWGQDDYFMGRSLDVFVSRLRKILHEDPRISIENIRNVGFRLRVDI